MKSAIPVMSLDGWVNNPNTMMSKLFEYFLASQYSQSNTFNGNISSLKYLIANNKDPYALRKEIEKELTKLYTSYFTSITPDIMIVEFDSSSVIKLHIEITAKYNNITYTLSREISSTNGDIAIFDKELEALNLSHNNY